MVLTVCKDEQRKAEQEVRAWGFDTVYTWTDKPCVLTVSYHRFSSDIRHAHRRTYYKPHSHQGLTTHLILAGDLTIAFPKDDAEKKETHGVGARVDVAANQVHEVWVGDEGCVMVIGEE